MTHSVSPRRRNRRSDSPTPASHPRASWPFWRTSNSRARAGSRRTRAAGSFAAMAEIGFIDQTLRDGPQSLWGMRMRAQHATPALPHLNATGFDTIDLLGATSMVVMLRESGDDPWAWVDHLISNLPDQPLRSALRPVAAGSFGFVPEGILNLWIEVLVKHGVESHWLFDCLYDMPLMKQRTRGTAGGRRRSGAGDHVRALRTAHRRVLRRPRPRNGELARGGADLHRGRARRAHPGARRDAAPGDPGGDPRRPPRDPLPQHHRPRAAGLRRGDQSRDRPDPHGDDAARQRPLAALDRGDGGDRRGARPHPQPRQIAPQAGRRPLLRRSGADRLRGRRAERVPHAPLQTPAAGRHDRDAEKPAERVRDAGEVPAGDRGDRPSSAPSSASR